MSADVISALIAAGTLDAKLAEKLFDLAHRENGKDAVQAEIAALGLSHRRSE